MFNVRDGAAIAAGSKLGTVWPHAMRGYGYASALVARTLTWRAYLAQCSQAHELRHVTRLCILPRTMAPAAVRAS